MPLICSGRVNEIVRDWVRHIHACTLWSSVLYIVSLGEKAQHAGHAGRRHKLLSPAQIWGDICWKGKWKLSESFMCPDRLLTCMWLHACSNAYMLCMCVCNQHHAESVVCCIQYRDALAPSQCTSWPVNRSLINKHDVKEGVYRWTLQVKVKFHNLPSSQNQNRRDWFPSQLGNWYCTVQILNKWTKIL